MLTVVPCRHGRNAVNVQQVRQGPCACLCIRRVCTHMGVGVRFDALGADEYLVVVRVVWDAMR